MIRIVGVTKDLKLIETVSINDLDNYDLSWYWVDFNMPNKTEKTLLINYFNFHTSSIQDCIFSFNKPKLNYFEEYSFFIVNTLSSGTFDPKEISLFVSKNFIVTYHSDSLNEIDETWKRVKIKKNKWDKGPIYVTHQILDEIVEQFFPAVYKIEDQLDELDSNITNKSIHKLIDEVFKIRSDLLKLRRLINSTRDLVYRILNSERLSGFRKEKLYFSDIYDHLLKLSDMIDSSRDMTSDMRDSYLSVNSNRMNTNMMLLTVVTSIFIPLTFIAGVYGMNFRYMPELEWRYGYFLALVLMIAIGVLMFLWFKRKGWFDT